MKIKVHNGLELRLPTGLALNGLTAFFLARRLRADGDHISPAQLHEFFRAVRRYRRDHPEWVLVEVLSGGKEAVQIWL